MSLASSVLCGHLIFPALINKNCIYWTWSFSSEEEPFKHSLSNQHCSLLEALSRPLTCPSFTSLKQYLNPDCCVYVPPPLTVWAWTPPGAGAPADPEEEEEDSIRSVGVNPDTWIKEDKYRCHTNTTILVSKYVQVQFSSNTLHFRW